MIKEKTVVGLTQKIKIISPDGKKTSLVARIDTGATSSSIDKHLAEHLKLGPEIKKKMIRSASGSGIRSVIKISIEIKERRLKSKFTIADRAHMKYKALIGQNILKRRFLIDPSLG
jgi:hypothetical protein